FRDPRILAAGLLLLWPFEAAGHAVPLAIVMDLFLVLMTMWLVVFLTTSADRAKETIARQGALAAVTSGLARARDEDGLFAELAGLAPALAPGCAWAFWAKDPTGDEFRAIRWAGLARVTVALAPPAGARAVVGLVLLAQVAAVRRCWPLCWRAVDRRRSSRLPLPPPPRRPPPPAAPLPVPPIRRSTRLNSIHHI